MKPDGSRGIAASFAVAASALLAASLAVTPAHAGIFGKKKQAPVVVVAPPPPPPKPMGLARPIIEAASSYVSYMQTATAIPNKFADGASVSSALRTGVHSEQRRLQEGVIAYGAIVALQDPAFVEAVKTYASNPASRQQIARNIMADPTYVVAIAGHESAAGLVIATLYNQGARLKAQGELVKKESLDIQLKGAWSKATVPNLMGRLQEVKNLSTSMAPAAPELSGMLDSAARGQAQMGLSPGQPVQPPYTPAVIRSLAIAALAVLGEAGDDNPYITRLLVDNQDGFCFNMSKLNLYQCISVAKPYYEDMYCLGLHVMTDTGQCVMNSAGGAPGSGLAPSVLAVNNPEPAVAAVPEKAPAKRAPHKRK
jgi:hypothetical protein